VGKDTKIMEDGKWKMENGRWKMEDGRWRMEDERRVDDPHLPFYILPFTYLFQLFLSFG
jgi:hypothetical protein